MNFNLDEPVLFQLFKLYIIALEKIMLAILHKVEPKQKEEPMQPALELELVDYSELERYSES